MKRTQKNKQVALFLLVILAVSFIVTQTAIGAFLLSSPWWIYFVLVGIGLSGYMTVKYFLEDRRYENEWIESEGNVYIRRMEEEKERRNIEQS